MTAVIRRGNRVNLLLVIGDRARCVRLLLLLWVLFPTQQTRRFE